MDSGSPSLVFFVDDDILRFEYDGSDEEPIKLETGQEVPVMVRLPRNAKPQRLAIAFWERSSRGGHPWQAPVNDEVDRLLRGHASEFEQIENRIWKLVRPTKLTIMYPGRYAFVAELIYRDDNGKRRRAKLDPEVDVRGGYPPHG
ncbi:MAG: hypothetical protein AAGE94_02370 [Acidobacteriota bacterium]